MRILVTDGAGYYDSQGVVRLADKLGAQHNDSTLKPRLLRMRAIGRKDESSVTPC